jgi:hypothetical protein
VWHHEYLQERAYAAAFLIESVGGNAGWHLAAGKRTAHCNHQDFRESVADYLQKLES